MNELCYFLSMQVKCNPPLKSIGFSAYGFIRTVSGCVAKWIAPRLVLLSLTCVAYAAPVELSIGRAYGYVIGDVIEQTALVEAAQASTLDMATLPKPGRQGGWVELVAPVKVARLDEQHLRLQLRYQVMNAPREVALAFLPSYKLKLQLTEGQIKEISLPSQAISVSPMSKEEAFTRTGMEAIRPERIVMPMAAEAIAARAKAWFTATVLSFGLAGLLLWWRRRRQAEGPFARATRALRAKLSDEHAIRLVHTAFNETAGHSVFAESLESFFAQHPHYDAMRAQITQFFAMSRQVFFDTSMQGQPAGSAQGLQHASSLYELTRHLARIERRSEA